MAAQRVGSPAMGLMVSAAWLSLAALPLAAQEADALADERQQAGDIIVTAQRSEQRIQDVPLSISALSGAQLSERGITTLQQLRGATPNLYVEPSLGQNSVASIYLRGLGQINPSFFYDAPVAVYEDGVYLARAYGSLVDLFDVQRVEVLRGPQGTLFGRNASAGAIVLVSNQPDPTQVEGRAEFAIGSRLQRNVAGMINLPLSADRLAVRASVFYRGNDGFQRDLFSADRSYTDDIVSGRAAIRWDPSDAVDVTVRGNFILDRGENPRPERFSANTPFRYESNFRADEQFNNTDVWGVSGTVNADLGPVRVQSITAYRSIRNRARAEGDGNRQTVGVFENLRSDLDNWAFTQETTLAGDSLFGSSVKWVAGMFLFSEYNDSAGSLLILPFPPFFPANTQLFTQKTESIGLFGQAIVPLSERFSVTAGLRYTWDKKRVSGRQLLDLTGQLDPDFIFDGTLREDKPTWRLAATWQASETVNVYVNSGTGFRSGNFNGGGRSVADIEAFGLPTETILMVEGGVKASLFDRRMTLNANYYFQRVNNLQLEVLTETGVSQRNLKVNVHGIEADFDAALSDRMRMFGHVASIFDEPEQLPGSLSTGLPRAPRWSGAIGASYEVPVPSPAGFVALNSDLRWTSDYENTDTGVPQLRQEGFAIWNASLGYRSANERISFRAEVQNITNKVYLLSGFFIPGLVEVKVPSLPRRFLFTVSTQF